MCCSQEVVRATYGVDVNVIEPTQEDVDEVDEILEPLGLVDKSREWRKMISVILEKELLMKMQ